MSDLKEDLKNISAQKGVKIFFTLLFLLLFSIFFFTRFFYKETLNGDQYIIGRDTTWHPLNLLGKDALMVGFTNDLMVEIARREGVSLSIQNVGSEGLFQGLNEARYHGVISSLTPTSINEQYFEFSDPFYFLGPVVIVRKDSTIESLEELQGKSIGIQAGSTFAYRTKNFPLLLFSYYPNIRNGIDDLVDEKLDAVVMDVLPAYAYLRGQYGAYLKLLGTPLTVDGLRIVSRRDPKGLNLISIFDKGLEKVIRDGTYRKLLTKWDLIETLPLPAENLNSSVIQ
jgi:polar amino acid transport system substrate-binding protein